MRACVNILIDVDVYVYSHIYICVCVYVYIPNLIDFFRQNSVIFSFEVSLPPAPTPPFTQPYICLLMTPIFTPMLSVRARLAAEANLMEDDGV